MTQERIIYSEGDGGGAQSWIAVGTDAATGGVVITEGHRSAPGKAARYKRVAIPDEAIRALRAALAEA